LETARIQPELQNWYQHTLERCRENTRAFLAMGVTPDLVRQVMACVMKRHIETLQMEAHDEELLFSLAGQITDEALELEQPARNSPSRDPENNVL
jgi:hypothetical protein